jgi:hypothetical protein
MRVLTFFLLPWMVVSFVPFVAKSRSALMAAASQAQAANDICPLLPEPEAKISTADFAMG